MVILVRRIFFPLGGRPAELEEPRLFAALSTTTAARVETSPEIFYLFCP
jgi:hypothetical protein